MRKYNRNHVNLWNLYITLVKKKQPKVPRQQAEAVVPTRTLGWDITGPWNALSVSFFFWQ